MRYSNVELLKMHEHLVRGRLFAIKMQEAVAEGLIRISFHSPLGQEAASVGMMSALADDDWFIPTHRSQCSMMMRLPLREYIAELFCRKAGINGGVSFDYHLNDFDYKLALPVAILGADFPIYTGFAWALKKKGLKDVVVVEAGDGACSEGATYEAWNLAALYKVPCVYVVMTNQWGMSVPLNLQSVNPNISEKAIPIGLSTQIVDGNDILAVREAMEIAIEKARNYEPNVIELKTLRWADHFVGQRAYPRHDQARLEEAKINDDPVVRYETYLIENGVATKEQLDKKTKEIDDELVEIINWAKELPSPEFDDVFRPEYVYANPETGGAM